MATRTLNESAPLNLRFTPEGGPAIESLLRRICQQVSEAVREAIPGRALEAVALGGGYGRGDGGVLKDECGEHPYNDLEFYVFVRGSLRWNELKHRDRLRHLGERLTEAAGVEIEFKIVSERQLRSSPVTMFYYDLVSGHKICWGRQNVLDSCAHHRCGEKIPLHEALRLLMNRCSGLLFAAEHLQRRPFTAHDADFVGRNLAKAQLAMGDVLLAAHGRYHWSCRERHERLRRLRTDFACWPEIVTHHAAGVRFKFNPVRRECDLADFWTDHAELSNLGLKLWLWLEGKRFNRQFLSIHEYALGRFNRCPETNPLRNLVINLRENGPGLLWKPPRTRYPRERLLQTLSLLLWEESVFRDPALLAFVQEKLNTQERTFHGVVHAYERLWKRFN